MVMPFTTLPNYAELLHESIILTFTIDCGKYKPDMQINAAQRCNQALS
jgi:hypothetical protein